MSTVSCIYIYMHICKISIMDGYRNYSKVLGVVQLRLSGFGRRLQHRVFWQIGDCVAISFSPYNSHEILIVEAIHASCSQKNKKHWCQLQKLINICASAVILPNRKCMN